MVNRVSVFYFQHLAIWVPACTIVGGLPSYNQYDMISKAGLFAQCHRVVAVVMAKKKSSFEPNRVTSGKPEQRIRTSAAF